MGKTSIVAVAFFAAVAFTGTAAFAQDAVQTAPNPAAQSSPAQKPKVKVWTDDNIDSVRTPADDYQIQQEQQREAQQAVAQENAKTAAVEAAAKAGPAPKTVKQADSMIAAKKQTLADQQQYLQRVQKDLNNPNNSAFDQMRLNWRLKSHTATAQQTQAQLKQLEDERAALAKQEAAEKAAVGASGGSSSAGSAQ